MKKALSLILTLALLLSASSATLFIPAEASATSDKLGFANLQSVDQTKLEQLKAILIKAWDDFDAEVEIATLSISIDDIQEYYFGILNKLPEYFYVKTEFKYTYSPISNNVLKLNLVFLFQKSELAEATEKFNAEVDDIISYTNSSMTAADLALTVHDQIVLRSIYDTAALTDSSKVKPLSYSAYGCLVDGVAVCQGFTYAFNYIMEKLGYECEFMNSESMNHAWSLIKIDGKYYHVDVTWDNALSKVENEYYDRLGYCVHDNFLLSDTEIAKNHSGWASEYKATSSMTNKYWKSGVSAYIYKNGAQYYISALGSIAKRDIFTGKSTDLFIIQKDEWNVSGSSYYVWDYSFSRLAFDGENIYFNRAKLIYRYNTDNNTATPVFDAKLTNSYITGLGFEDDELKYDTCDVNKRLTLRLKTGVMSGYKEPTTTEPPTTEPSDDFKYGDCNFDNAVNAKDVLRLKQHLASWVVDINLAAADVNADNSVNAKDLLRLKQYLANWPVVLGKDKLK